jgi:histidinol-phosphate aminotransferase
MTSAVSRGRASLRDVALYYSRNAAAVDLSDNTNRWGVPPAAAAALRGAHRAMRYPEPYAQSLKEVIAEYLDVDANCVTTGCGSDGVLDSAIRAFADAGDRIAIAQPTFPMTEVFARVNGLVPLSIPLTDGYDLDVEGMLAGAPRLAYVCAPNNPTGTCVTRARIEALARGLDGVLIVDEAYADFAESSCLDLARSQPNVLVVRTMSKAFGLAGARVGFAVGQAALVREVEKSRGPFRVSVSGAAAATAALRHDLPWVRSRAMDAIAVRERLIRELQVRGLTPLPSAANFVFVPVAGAMALAKVMEANGVSVRAFRGLAPVSPALAASNGEALRITCAPWPEIELALAALDAARAEAACT